jgi:hypothetical protein
LTTAAAAQTNLLGLEDGIDEQRVQLLVRVVDAQLRLKK